MQWKGVRKTTMKEGKAWPVTSTTASPGSSGSTWTLMAEPSGWRVDDLARIVQVVAAEVTEGVPARLVLRSLEAIPEGDLGRIRRPVLGAPLLDLGRADHGIHGGPLETGPALLQELAPENRVDADHDPAAEQGEDQERHSPGAPLLTWAHVASGWIRPHSPIEPHRILQELETVRVEEFHQAPCGPRNQAGPLVHEARVELHEAGAGPDSPIGLLG